MKYKIEFMNVLKTIQRFNSKLFILGGYNSD